MKLSFASTFISAAILFAANQANGQKLSARRLGSSSPTDDAEGTKLVEEAMSLLSAEFIEGGDEEEKSFDSGFVLDILCKLNPSHEKCRAPTHGEIHTIGLMSHAATVFYNQGMNTHSITTGGGDCNPVTKKDALAFMPIAHDAFANPNSVYSMEIAPFAKYTEDGVAGFEIRESIDEDSARLAIVMSAKHGMQMLKRATKGALSYPTVLTNTEAVNEHFAAGHSIHMAMAHIAGKVQVMFKTLAENSWTAVETAGCNLAQEPNFHSGTWMVGSCATNCSADVGEFNITNVETGTLNWATHGW